ncbi:PREDICTED: uncharacterized protein LOC108536057 [Rhinopithecus bieti]|uniref:uncharacterized protein LOC108536057 n=1 Tax=Rhinopithecus bieti TaxID=61621 RepID=UPI00083BA925|nr:PREDICTED: uncharacterized protein LOC108536057 [Rhinopithecus bieti]
MVTAILRLAQRTLGSANPSNHNLHLHPAAPHFLQPPPPGSGGNHHWGGCHSPPTHMAAAAPDANGHHSYHWAIQALIEWRKLLDPGWPKERVRGREEGGSLSLPQQSSAVTLLPSSGGYKAPSPPQSFPSCQHYVKRHCSGQVRIYGRGSQRNHDPVEQSVIRGGGWGRLSPVSYKDPESQSYRGVSDENSLGSPKRTRVSSVQQEVEDLSLELRNHNSSLRTKPERVEIEEVCGHPEVLAGLPTSYSLQRVPTIRTQNLRNGLIEILGMLELETIREVRLHHRSRSCFVSDLIQFFTQKLLETLVVNGYRLTENDITYLSQSIHATQLKELVLCSNNLSQIVPGPLEFLLSEVSGTLQHLNLRNCKLKEAQIRALLPALCCCSHLRSLIFHHNVISTSGIMNVLQHLAGLKELKRVQYPVSAECVVYLDGYRWENINRVELASVHTKLLMLQTLQQADMELINSTSSLTYENAQLT